MDDDQRGGRGVRTRLRACVTWLGPILTAISVGLLAATLAAWVATAEHPWSDRVELEKINAHGGIVFGEGEGTWQLVWGSRFEDGSDWGWDISGDQWAFDIRPQGSTYEWRIGWWKLVLLWLVVPLWRYTPWRSIGINRSPGAIKSYQWLLYKSRTRLVARRQELKSVLLAHCVASYAFAAIVVVAIVLKPEHVDYEGAIWFAGALALAPLILPLVVLATLQDMGGDLLWVILIVGGYLFVLLVAYCRRMNRLIRA